MKITRQIIEIIKRPAHEYLSDNEVLLIGSHSSYDKRPEWLLDNILITCKLRFVLNS